MYLWDAESAAFSDHNPLDKFSKGKTEANKVNNWSIELSTQNLNIQYVKRINNILEETMVLMQSWLTMIMNQKGQEFGWTLSEELPTVSNTDIITDIISPNGLEDITDSHIKAYNALYICP